MKLGAAAGGLMLATHGYADRAIEALTEFQRVQIRLCGEEKIVSLSGGETTSPIAAFRSSIVAAWRMQQYEGTIAWLWTIPNVPLRDQMNTQLNDGGCGSRQNNSGECGFGANGGSCDGRLSSGGSCGG